MLPTRCTYVFRMILIINSYYFFVQHKPVDLGNGEELCFLCGTDWILKYYSNELRLQRDNLLYVEKIKEFILLTVIQNTVYSKYDHEYHV
jgi:hypothetical protein